jgi:metal-dependent amidase/aminoacylase/carboxypeptidase family protein
MIGAAIERRCAGVAAANGCTIEFDWIPGYPPTINDPAMADYVATIAKQTFSPERYFPVPRPSMGGEDFAYYLEQVPGCFFLVGVEPLEHSGYPPLHSDRFDFTDTAMAVGMRMFVELVRSYGK